MKVEYKLCDLCGCKIGGACRKPIKVSTVICGRWRKIDICGNCVDAIIKESGKKRMEEVKA